MTLTIAPSPPADRAEQAVPLALELVDAVRCWRRGDVQCVLDRADKDALLVVLAAMVDDARTVTDALSWAEQRTDLHDGWTWEDLLAAHSSWQAHRYRGLTPPEHVREGQRVYDRVRSRRRRAAARAVSA